MISLTFENLKERQRKGRNARPRGVDIRIHRALSWLQAAEGAGDTEEAFIFLWIAFNAIYAREFDPGSELSEKDAFKDFLHQLIRLDAEGMLYDVIWHNYSGKIRLFIDNQYVSRHFWSHQNGLLTEAEWEKGFESSKRAAQRALAKKDTFVFSSILFDRLYMLRNQLFHGGATWHGKINRAQIRDGARILQSMIPVIIHLVLENPNESWGEPCFPPLQE